MTPLLCACAVVSTRACSRPSSLSCLLINDLPCSISSDCSIFADDTSVYNTGSKPPSICSMLSKDLNYAADRAVEWGMLFNAEKSEHFAISTRKSEITSPHVTMNGTQIPQVTSHKHIGVNFNNTLSWQQHVDKVYTSVLCSENRNDPVITTKAAPGCSEANLLGSSTALRCMQTFVGVTEQHYHHFKQGSTITL